MFGGLMSNKTFYIVEYSPSEDDVYSPSYVLGIFTREVLATAASKYESERRRLLGLRRMNAVISKIEVNKIYAEFDIETLYKMTKGP